MKHKLLTMMISGILVSQLGWAGEVNHVGSQVLDKNEIIDMLQPKMKTRGIRINQPAQAAANTQQTQQVSEEQAYQQQTQQQTQEQTQQVAAVEQQQAPAAPPTISMEINFEYNSANLTDQALQQLAPLGQALQSPELNGLSFLLEGHTDASGPDNYNMTLSELRAQSVGQFLYQYYGVDPSNLNLIGRGESALLDPNNPTSGANRRVTITTVTY